MATELFTMFPWVGGLNTSLDPSTIEPNELVQADNLVFGTRGSRKKREGIDHDWDDQSSGAASVIGLTDYWYGTSSRTQKRVAVHSDGAVYTYTSGGVRSADIFAGTAWASTVTRASFAVVNDKLIIAVDGSGNVMKSYDGTTFQDLAGTPPKASMMQLHRGRLFTNDKDNIDLLCYSPIQDAETWGGYGDSGAIPVGRGDGDPEGITAIFPSFKGDLFVAKRTKLYRIIGDNPEDWVIQLVSNGIGCVSHESVSAVDQDEIYFTSERGVHTLTTTSNFGDYSAAFVSAPIQNDFNSYFIFSRRKYIKSAYLPEINSVVFAVTDSRLSGASANNALYLFNVPLKSWYRWPNLPAQSLAMIRDTDKVRLYLGRSDGRIAKTMNGTVYDVSTSGTNTAIQMTLKTGFLQLGSLPFGRKGFKKFSLIYAPDGNHTITVSGKIDNQSSQSTAFTQTTGDILGSSFVLGTSMLAAGSVVAPYTIPDIEGYGRSIQITMEQSGVNERLEIQGFQIEYEPAGLMQEVV